MTKLDLVTQQLINTAAATENPDVMKHEVKTALKTFACDLLNMVEGLRANNVSVPVIKNMVEEYGLSFNAKSKKFS